MEASLNILSMGSEGDWCTRRSRFFKRYFTQLAVGFLFGFDFPILSIQLEKTFSRIWSHRCGGWLFEIPLIMLEAKTSGLHIRYIKAHNSKICSIEIRNT